MSVPSTSSVSTPSVSGEVLVLASPDVAVGFRLAGVRAESPATPRELLAALSTPSPNTALLLVEEPLLRRLTAADRERLEQRAIPVLVPFPAAHHDTESATGGVLELLRRAIGYRVRLQ